MQGKGTLNFKDGGKYVGEFKNDEFEGCRVTPHVYTTIEEIDRFSDAMEEIIKNGVG